MLGGAAHDRARGYSSPLRRLVMGLVINDIIIFSKRGSLENYNQRYIQYNYFNQVYD